jgi:DNA-binding winged helix-turn-helix (wHTH) protein/tetratricopeptide (TPR) repeat protein
MGVCVLRFAGFELDQRRAELRGSNGEPVKLTPKQFAMLHLFAANAGQVIGKQQLMETIWPNVNVSEDSLFQCISELRAALGDDQRRLIKVVSRRGYLFDAEVSGETTGLAAPIEPAPAARETDAGSASKTSSRSANRRLLLASFRGRAAVSALTGLCAIIGIAVAAPIIVPGLVFERMRPAIGVMPIVEATNDPQVASMARSVTDGLTNGLAKIENIRLVAMRPGPTLAASEATSAPPAPADFVVNGQLQKSAQTWTLEASMTEAATGEVQWSTSVRVDSGDGDLALQQSRLVAGLGHELALRINNLVYSDSGSDLASAGEAKVVVEQAIASISQTTRERFAAAQTMLESALAQDSDDVDLAVALAALQTRGIQMVWYAPAESTKAETEARSLLNNALSARPGYIPGLEAYCRYLTATSNLVESLVACARVLNLDPWHGSALYQLGLTQILLGRFEDALATFTQADRFDTPAVSRWTWLLGIGWANVLLGHDEEALPWLKKSIAITPASGRPYLLLAVAYQRLGRQDEAKAALAKAMELRPNSTALNVAPPTRNAGQAFLEATRRFNQILVEVGLPEG